MTLKDSLTPKGAEEVKPGLFVQKKGNGWRKIEPIVWEGRWRLKNQFGWRNLFTIALVILLAYTYVNETSFCRQLQANPCQALPEIVNYCSATSTTGGILQSEEPKDIVTIQDYP